MGPTPREVGASPYAATWNKRGAAGLAWCRARRATVHLKQSSNRTIWMVGLVEGPTGPYPAHRVEQSTSMPYNLVPRLLPGAVVCNWSPR